MKKVLIISLSAVATLLIAAAVVFFVMFGTKSKHYSAIPDGSVYLAKVNFGNLLNKSEILEQSVVSTALDMVVNSMPRDTRSLMREIVTDPSESGINVAQPAVFAITGDVENCLFVFSVKDKPRLDEVVNLFAEEFNEMNIDEVDGLTRIDYGKRKRRQPYGIAYNNDMFVVVVNMNGKKATDVETFFNLPAEEQAMNDSEYSKFFSQNDDAAMFINFEEILDSKKIGLSRKDKEMFAPLKDFSLFMSLNLENGYAEFAAAIDTSDEYKEMIKEVWMDASQKHFEYIPGDAIIVANGAIDCEKLLAMEQAKPFLKELKQMGIKTRMLEDLSGDITFAMLQPAQMGRREEPQFMFVADCESSELFEQCIKFIKEYSDVEYVDEDVYALGMNKYKEYDYIDYSYVEKTAGYDYYMMYNDGKIFFLPQNVYEEIVYAGELSALENSAATSDTYKSFKGSGMIFSFKELVDAIVATTKRMSASDREIVEFMEIFNTVEVIVENPFEVKARVTLTDDRSNFLKVMVDEVFSMFSKEIMSNF